MWGGVGWLTFGSVMPVEALRMDRFTRMGATVYTMPGFVHGMIGVVAMLLDYLVTLPEVRDLFLDRITLVKSYDQGERGRFGIQLNSIQYLLESPFGFGPTLFRKLFGQDPHNVYLNAFASYGWLGGVAYMLLALSTIVIGFKAVMYRTPWQNASIVVYSAMLATILQGIQIDTDHWRHYYWMLGLTWGLYAASAAYVPPRQRTTAS